jgi:predicted transcriptional regulator
VAVTGYGERRRMASVRFELRLPKSTIDRVSRIQRDGESVAAVVRDLILVGLAKRERRNTKEKQSA